METAVITEASAGIGASVARLFADEGVHVVCGGRDHNALESVKTEVREDGGRVTVQRADVRDEFDLERLMEAAARESGPINCVVACTDVHHGMDGTLLQGESYAAFDDHVRANGRGVFATVREAVPHLATDARVLVPVREAPHRARPSRGSYAVSEALAVAVARQFSADLDQTVGILHVGAEADPAEVAPMVWWAASEADPGTVDGRVIGHEAWQGAR